MSGLDTRYVPLFYLQDVMVDKTTGDLLSGGEVDFYKDDDRNIPKDVYMISGVAPNYIYTNIGSQLFLSAVGTFVDGSGNDINPYVFPYDGDASTTTNTLELYYIVVKDSTGTPQYTREGVPNLSTSSTPSGAAGQVKNYAPNGQFLLHNNHLTIPSGTTIAYGGTAGTLDQTIPAPGGWFFERTPGGTAVDSISFNVPTTQFNGAPAPNGASPRFAMRVNRTVSGSGSDIAQLSIRFMDVNKFYNQEITVLFSAKLASGTSLSGINIYELDYYGTSNSGTGSATSPAVYTNKTPITPISLTASWQQIARTFTTNANDTNTFGADNNDFVEFCIVFPAGSTYNIDITDMIIVLGAASGSSGSGTSFPITNNGQFIIDAMDSLAPTTTNPINSAAQPYYPQDGGNLYLPVIMTTSGFTYDYSEIGTVVAAGNLSNFSGSVCTNGNRLIANGAQYKSTDYSALGIPYARLGSYYLSGGSSNVPQFGTGLNFATAYVEAGGATKLIFTLNKVGSQVAPADFGTTFTFTNLITGSAGYGFAAYSNGTGLITAIDLVVGAPIALADTGTSGMTTLIVRNNAATYYAFTVQALSAAALGNGAGTAKYFDFSSTTTSYRMWFRTATETAPAAGGRTLVQLNLDLVMTVADVGIVLANAISGFQEYQITAVAASSFASGAYFTFVANSQLYVVWYNKDGGGTAPVVGGSILIEVPVNSADSATAVALATQIRINRTYFATPNLLGLYLRGYDPTGEWDIDYLSRYSFINNLTGGNAGTFELDQFASHKHPGSYQDGVNGTANGPPWFSGLGTSTLREASIPIVVALEGGSETRSVNMSVVWAVKY